MRILYGAIGTLLAALAGAALAAGMTAPDPKLAFEAVSADRVKHGERLAWVLGCKGCHTPTLAGRMYESDPKFAILYASNLTRTMPAYSDAALERAISGGVGIDGTPLWAMPSSRYARLGKADMAALIAYLRTVVPIGDVHPRIVIGPVARQEIAAGKFETAAAEARNWAGLWPARAGAKTEFGRYLAAATCSGCHGSELRGDPHPSGENPAPDLIVAAAYSRDQFRHLMRNGEPPDGRDLGLMKRVSPSHFGKLTEREMDALHDYLVARAASAQ